MFLPPRSRRNRRPDDLHPRLSARAAALYLAVPGAPTTTDPTTGPPPPRPSSPTPSPPPGPAALSPPNAGAAVLYVVVEVSEPLARYSFSFYL